tara:strand:+ start:2952 stop:3632 length:681 start_codon:yes stop_codon:yes gene_type:complete
MKKNKDGVVLYQAKSGAIELKADMQRDTIWLTQQQMTELFDVQKAAISKHLKNIFVSEELEEKAAVSILETTAKDGKTYRVKYFNLDAVLSVGYRVNSKQATHFRQWATKTLKQHILDGYTINRRRIKTNHEQFLAAVDDVKNLLPTGVTADHASILELITLFADTWFSLDAYAFIWFLQKAKLLNTARITPQALTALTLLVAESNPKEKDKMVGLVCALLRKTNQ